MTGEREARRRVVAAAAEDGTIAAERLYAADEHDDDEAKLAGLALTMVKSARAVLLALGPKYCEGSADWNRFDLGGDAVWRHRMGGTLWVEDGYLCAGDADGQRALEIHLADLDLFIAGEVPHG